MSDNNNSFVFYKSFYDAIKVAPKKHQLALYSALTCYVFENKTPQLESTSLAIWNAIKPQIDASLKRYENAKKGAEYGKLGAEYGKLGGRPKKGDKKPPLRGKDKNPLDYDSDLDSDSDSYSDSDSDSNSNKDLDNNKPPNPLKGAAGKRFTKPSVSEIRDYCEERNNGIDAQEFFDFYEAKGWMIGRSPMKDWRACVRTWEKNARNRNAPDRYADIDDWLRRRTQDDEGGVFDNS